MRYVITIHVETDSKEVAERVRSEVVGAVEDMVERGAVKGQEVDVGPLVGRSM